MFVIGERINPSGRLSLALALLDGRIQVFQKEALEQERLGVDALDINIYLPRIDRVQAMRLAVQGVRCVSRLPMVVDDREAEIIRVGLECGGADIIVNTPLSSSGVDPKVIELLHQFKTKIIFVPLKKNTPPKLVRDRIRTSRTIVKELERNGISRKRMYVDALLFPVKRAKEKIVETLTTIKGLRSELGVSTVIGLSNVSYGLKHREQVNAAFLKLAKSAGLDAAILNPLQQEVMKEARAAKKISLNRSEINRFFEFTRSLK